MPVRLFVLSCVAILMIAMDGGPPVSAASTLQAPVDWPAYNNDPRSDRYAALTQIDAANVGRLHTLCSASLGGPLTLESGPIVVAGNLYISTVTQTFAFDATTCKPEWVNTYTPARRFNDRGVAYGGGLIFRGFGDGHVIAINAATGATVWNVAVIGSTSLEVISAAPIVWQNTVIIGTANGEAGQVCHVMALAAATGTVLWSVATVPNSGTPPASTWMGATHIAGGATWSSFTVDPVTGTLYLPTGNPGPDYDDRDRLGANLYTNAVLGLDAQTGGFRAAIQLVHEDVHDWDQAAAPALAILPSGATIALIAGKDGFLRSIDIHSLAEYWKVPVTTLANTVAPIVTAGTHFCPSGAVLWNGAAYSPATNLAYVNAVDSCRTVYLEATPAPYVPGQSWLGSAKVVPDAAASGWLRAFNASTGAAVWHYHSTAPLIAGVTPTAGGLLFTADLLGDVLAFDAAQGMLLTSVPIGLPVGGGVISYAVNGTQYVAVAAGLNSPDFHTSSATAAVVVLGI